ncbi:MAG: hypothetical protein IJW93_01790 [Clostridia bacterium]|nr:hypothetical protein [Clostridia bacterium]
MKRIICLVLALVLCLAAFTGCEMIEGIFGPGEQQEPDEHIDNAVEYLSTMYKDLSGSHAKDFDVVGQVPVQGVMYPVTWTVDHKDVTIRESVKINYFTVDIPSDNTADVVFTLTATVKSPKTDETREKTFEIKVPAATAEGVLSIPAAIELGKAQANSAYTSTKYYVSGTVSKIENTTYGNLYIADADGNEILVYGTYDATGKTRFDKMSNQPKVGDTVTFYSVVGNYNGTPQLKNAWLTALNGEELGGGEQGGNQGGTSTGILLDMMGKTNLESNSGEQTVYSANGITYTNDKASSTTPNYSNISSYAARAYAGSTIKIEYTGMTKIVLVLDDYSPEAGKDYLKGFDGMTVEGATIVRENDVVTIYFAAATNVFQSAPLGAQVRIEQIEVYTGAVETPPAGGNGGSGDSGNTGSYEAPVAGKAYKFYLEQTTLGKTLYFAGTMDSEKGTYLATTEDKSAAVDIYFEVVDGGYHIYFMNGNTKTYINAAAYLKDNGYAGCHFELGTQPICVWTYNTTYGIIEIYDEVEGKSDTFFAGTFGDYNTISLSGAYYKDQISSGTQFPARIVLSEGGNTGNEGGNIGNEGGNTGNEGGNTGNEGGNTGNEGTDAPVISGSASLDFSDVANRTELSNDKQVWEQNGVKLTNDKSGSNVNVADYSNPARFYANSALTIEYSKIVKIEFTCNTAAYAEALKNSIVDGNGTTVTVDGKVVTVELGTAVDSFAIATLGAQVRVNSITVYTGTAGDNTGNEGGNTGNEGGNTGNEGGNTDNEGGNTGNEGGNTGNEGGNTGDNDNTDDTPVVEVSKVTYDFKALFTETIQDTTTIKSSDDILTFNLVAGEAAANKAGQFRVYQGKAGVISSTKKIGSITMTANGKDGSAATVTVYVSNDGKDFVKVNTVEISTSAENTFSFGGAYTYVKIESQGKQLQITGLTVSYAE